MADSSTTGVGVDNAPCDSLGGSEQSSDRYKWYVVTLCTLAYLFAYIDRQILALLVEPVKADLHLTDTQFSFLHGLAFSLMYAFMGIPIARLADRHSRPLIIALGITFWSLATVACGISKTYWQMFLARMSVGTGEAALSPAAYSLFADLFSKSKLGRVVGTYSVGAFLGGGMAFIVGGLVIDLIEGMDAFKLPLLGNLRPWQLVFFVVGFPGLIIALLMFTTVREPQRQDLQVLSTGEVDQPTLWDTWSFIRKNRATFLCHYLGFSFYALALLAMLSWLPAFYMRNYALSATQTGYYLGTIVLLANTSGVFFGGYLSDFLHRRGNTDAPIYAGAIGAAMASCFGCWFVLVDDLSLSLISIVPAMFFLSFPMPTSTAAMQILAPNQMRAQVSAIFILVMNLFALGLGTTLVALVTDKIFHNERDVGYSLAIVVVVATISAAVLLQIGRHYFQESIENEAQNRKTLAGSL